MLTRLRSIQATAYWPGRTACDWKRRSSATPLYRHLACLKPESVVRASIRRNQRAQASSPRSTKGGRPDDGPNRYRRGMYTFFSRSAAHPSLVLFDAPIAQESVTRRNRSNTPLQALTLLNDESQTEFAVALAERVRDAARSRAEQIQTAFEICLARLPTEAEQARLNRFIARMTDEFATDPEAVEKAGADSAPDAAWTAAARVMINLDEFVTRQ